MVLPTRRHLARLAESRHHSNDPTLDGLGAVGGGAHADHEYVMVDAMAERAHLIAGLVRTLQDRLVQNP